MYQTSVSPDFKSLNLSVARSSGIGALARDRFGIDPDSEAKIMSIAANAGRKAVSKVHSDKEGIRCLYQAMGKLAKELRDIEKALDSGQEFKFTFETEDLAAECISAIFRLNSTQTSNQA